MARSKKHKRNTRNEAAFYEAVPMAITPPAAIPQASEHLTDGIAAITTAWHALLKRAQAVHWGTVPGRIYTISRQTGERVFVNLLWAGLATSNVIIHYSKSAALAARFGADTAVTYTPPAIADARAYARRLRRALWSKRSRALYTSLIAGGGFAAVIIGAVTATSVMSSYASDISSPSAVLSKKKTGTTILDRNGQVLFEGYGGQANTVVPLSELPKSLKDATLAAEDPQFYEHPGFSWRGITRAAWVDVTHQGTLEGGSTLTQQLVKNALLTSDRSFERKYQELVISFELEHRYTKDQILEMYLNEIYYGQGSSGIEAASLTYFHKPAKDLTLGESALLAGLPLGPSRFDPNASLEAATGRRDYVLTRMAELGKITPEQAKIAKSQPIKLASAGAPDTTPDSANPLRAYSKQVKLEAPHFVFYVLDQLRAQYGEAAVEQGGITVRTTLDLNKQHAAENSVRQQIGKLAEHHVTNGGLVSLLPGTGDIVAMVGSVDYNAPGFGNVNVTLSQLQPGSSFKPIAYATAFKKGWNGATQVDDAPMSVPNGDGSQYVPQNYDLKFRGPVTLRRALANSLNIPALKVLQFAGIHDTIQTAHDMGVTSLNEENRYGLSLVLGGGEVRPIDMATVYSTFANNGTKVEPRAILEVTDRHGQDITKHTDTKPKAVLDPRIAYMLTNILSDNDARTEEFGPNSPLKLSRPAAAKTGTTNDFRDNWTVGYTPQLVTAVWVGNNDHSAMNNVDGITGAAPIWHDYMESALANQPALGFTPPPGVTTARVCSDGGLAGPGTPGYDEVFLSDAVPTKPCASSFFQQLFNQDKKDKPHKDGDQTPPITPEPTPVDTPNDTPTPKPTKTPRFPPPTT
jgi:1A family penicillin-binding protein